MKLKTYLRLRTTRQRLSKERINTQALKHIDAHITAYEEVFCELLPTVVLLHYIITGQTLKIK